MNSESFSTADPGLKKAVANAANGAVKRYGRWGLTREMAVRHGWSWVVDHGDWVQQVMDDNERTWSTIISRLVRAECDYLGDRVRCARLGIQQWENFHYTARGVEVAVRAVYHPSGWMDAPTPETPGLAYYRPVSPHSDWIVSMADVSRAMKRLDPGELLTLEALYRAEVPNKRLAEAYGVSEQTMSDRKEAVLRKLVDILGGTKPKAQCIESCTHPPRYPSRVPAEATPCTLN